MGWDVYLLWEGKSQERQHYPWYQHSRLLVNWQLPRIVQHKTVTYQMTPVEKNKHLFPAVSKKNWKSVFITITSTTVLDYWITIMTTMQLPALNSQTLSDAFITIDKNSFCCAEVSDTRQSVHRSVLAIHIFSSLVPCDLFTPLLVINGHVDTQLRAFKFIQLHPDCTLQVNHTKLQPAL